VWFTSKMLGSWLGSSWFLLGSTLRDPQKPRFRFGRVEKMLGSWLGSTWSTRWLARGSLLGWLAGRLAGLSGYAACWEGLI